MSWLARSLVNSLKVDIESSSDEDDDERSNVKESSKTRESSLKIDKEEEDHDQIESPSEIPGRGVKEDLSELTKTFTRQLWGVASFLAPPSESSSSPPPHHPPQQISSTDPEASDWNRWDSSDQSVSGEVSDVEISESGRIAGIRSDFAEIGGRFKTGISKLSNHKAVSEISKIASSFLPFGSDETSEENYSIGDAVGVTEESVVFARNIAMHPDTWLDFPLVDDEDSEDFDMSDAQQEHALAVERLAPRLAALRMELSPGYMSEGCFWKIYFVLLHSRLNKHDAELLSTPQIVAARALLTRDIQDKAKSRPDHPGRDAYTSKESTDSLHIEHSLASSSIPTETMPLETFGYEPKSSAEMTDFEAVKHPIESGEMKIIDKSVVEEPAKQVVNKEPEIQNENKAVAQTVPHQTDEAEGNDWFNESLVIDSVVEEPMMLTESKEPLMQNESKGETQKVLHQTNEEDGDDWLHESKEPLTQNKSKGESQKILHQTDEEDGDDWLHESSEMDGFTGTNIPVGNDEDVSFSDLEDDDEDEDAKVKPKSRTVAHGSDSKSTKDPRDWVQLSRSSAESGDDGHHSIDSGHANKSENKVPKDWLNVDEQHCKTPL